MALRLCDVQCDPIADRALKELTHRYIVAEEKARLVLTEKAGNMKLFLNDLDDLHQWDFSHKASKRLFETRFSRKSGARSSASIKVSRPPAPRRGDHLRRLDSAVGHQATARGPFVLNRGVSRA